MGVIISLPLTKLKSTLVSGSSFVSAAKDLGIRKARLLPHFGTLVFIVPPCSIYKEYTAIKVERCCLAAQVFGWQRSYS